MTSAFVDGYLPCGCSPRLYRVRISGGWYCSGCRDRTGDGMIFSALDEAADRGELLLVHGGMCRFHRRRDGVVTIREILVLPSQRRQGIGGTLIRHVAERHPDATLRARCPADSEANAFWRGMGFSLVAETGGLKTWERTPC